MKVFFEKMHGCGNDFVVIDAFGMSAQPWDEWAKRLLDRRFGVGGDQLIILMPSKNADAKMATFERDGQESEMCGNGIRCAARLLKEKGLNKAAISFDTLAGMKVVEIESFDRIRVDMGKPIFESKKIPLNTSEKVWGKEIIMDGKKIYIYALSMGNPHAVIFVDNQNQLLWITDIGPMLERDSLFPKKTNVEFVFVKDSRNAIVRMWERGAGETLACGTGACAIGVVAITESKMKSPVTLYFKGGSLEIAWKMGEAVFMTGPASHVFHGEMEI